VPVAANAPDGCDARPKATPEEVWRDVVEADPRRLIAPTSRSELREYCRDILGLNIPDKSLCEGHTAPLDYLWHCISADAGPGMERRSHNADAVIWANRGGGKTQLAAIATVLDAVHKPGCEIRLLGGSGEQSRRAYRYVVALLTRAFPDMVSGEIRKTGCLLINDSSIELMTQSQTSVRGQHIQKLRCDEVELFDPDVLTAAKLTTQSKGPIGAAMELLSTVHRPGGLMTEELAAARARRSPIFHWCLWETIEPCRGRTCVDCPLAPDCRGRAREAAGYLRIDDVIQQMRRTSRATWEAEVLCLRPSTENLVFPDFDTNLHVLPCDFDPRLPLYRAIDFGFVAPFVCLWLQRRADGMTFVIDEYVRSRATIDVHAQEVTARTPVPEHAVAGTFCDPAGAAKEGLSGSTQVRALGSHGIVCRYRRSHILDGVDLVRRALRSGDGRTLLHVSPACPRLIEALGAYAYADGPRAAQEVPRKDGVYDHLIDALRYYFVNVEQKPTTCRHY
jgi:hypothetical protein